MLALLTFFLAARAHAQDPCPATTPRMPADWAVMTAGGSTTLGASNVGIYGATDFGSYGGSIDFGAYGASIDFGGYDGWGHPEAAGSGQLPCKKGPEPIKPKPAAACPSCYGRGGAPLGFQPGVPVPGDVRATSRAKAAAELPPLVWVQRDGATVLKAYLAGVSAENGGDGLDVKGKQRPDAAVDLAITNAVGWRLVEEDGAAVRRVVGWDETAMVTYSPSDGIVVDLHDGAWHDPVTGLYGEGLKALGLVRLHAIDDNDPQDGADTSENGFATSLAQALTIAYIQALDERVRD